jgi:hypothetical protein
VIRPIDTSEAKAATGQPHAKPAVEPATPAGKKSFAAHLASEKSSVGETAPRTSGKAAIEAPHGEVWRPVAGEDHYAQIMDGPRKGLYINLSRGARRGETFRVEMRDGRRVHVYGKGDGEKVIAAARDSGKVHGHHGKHLHGAGKRGETWAPVEGANNYADILSGPRNGYYVNTSGGSRDGMAFQIVKHGNRVFHVYGKGKHRQVVEVHHHQPHETKDAGDSAAAGNGGASPSAKRTG